jgi:hypothetical protein
MNELIKNIWGFICLLGIFAFLGFVFYMMFFGDGGCANQYSGSDCMDP